MPLTNNRSSIVWSETHERANDIMRLDDAAYLSVLRPRFGDFLGDIKLAGKRYKYPLSLSIAEEFVKPRFALIGDAAHGIHPLQAKVKCGIKGYREHSAMCCKMPIIVVKTSGPLMFWNAIKSGGALM